MNRNLLLSALYRNRLLILYLVLGIFNLILLVQVLFLIRFIIRLVYLLLTFFFVFLLGFASLFRYFGRLGKHLVLLFSFFQDALDNAEGDDQRDEADA